MVPTIVYIAHPDIASSSTQQFLLSSGREITEAEYVNLQEEYTADKGFDAVKEQKRLLKYDRIIFQFNLYWYQAPAILKLWLDTVLEESKENPAFAAQLAGKELGLVVAAGVKEEHYQTGGREKHTLSELLSPYSSLANYFEMKYIAPFSVHQFQFMDEEQKMELMYMYGCYIDQGTSLSKTVYRKYLFEKLQQLSQEQLPLSGVEQIVYDAWLNELEDQIDEIIELFQLTDRW